MYLLLHFYESGTTFIHVCLLSCCFRFFFSLLPLVSFEYRVAVIGRFCCFSLLLVLLKVFLISVLLILRKKLYLLVPHRRAGAYDICLAFGSCSSRKSSSWVMRCWVCLDLYFSWFSFLSFRCFSERSRMVWFVLCFDFLGKCLLQVMLQFIFSSLDFSC